jgi:LysR family transcriptional regulator, regulator for genes of the gallate degradation pathway
MNIWNLNIRHLRAIAKIAELGSMNAAAQGVNLTQPAITQALARIENLIGLPLFERRHNGMASTPAAELFIPRVRAALDHISSPHVTMSRMRALISLADTGSYNGASVATGLSLPSLHRAVSDLALASRKSLVERRGKIVILTEAGEAMARALRLARVEIETGLAELAAVRGHEMRRIAIGAMPLSRARVLPAAVARFLKRNPQVRVTIVEGSRAELVEPLRNGVIDLMIGAIREPLIEPDLVQKVLFSDRLVAIGRAGHPLAGKQPGVADLAQYPWIMSGEGTPLRLLWEQMFDRADVPRPSIQVESGSVMTIRQLLIDSDFLTLLSPDQVSVELEANWLAQVSDLPDSLARTIAVTTRSSWHPTKVQAEFLDDLDAVSG